MIARDVEIVDLQPGIWRNLISLLDISRLSDVRPAQPNILSILHHQGKVLRVYAPAGFRVPTIEQIDDPQELAKKLYYQLPGLESVQILEQDSLLLFSDRAQRMDWMQSDLEDFFLHAFHLAEQDPAGLSFFPTFSWKWNGFSIEDSRTWLTSGPDPCAYFLGIVRDGAPWLTLIARASGKKVRLITTIDYLARFGVPVETLPSGPRDLATVCEAIHAHVAPVRIALICDYMMFAKLLTSEEKRRDLTLATADGLASSFGLLE
jgi:hypothetical protein